MSSSSSATSISSGAADAGHSVSILESSDSLLAAGAAAAGSSSSATVSAAAAAVMGAAPSSSSSAPAIATAPDSTPNPLRTRVVLGARASRQGQRQREPGLPPGVASTLIRDATYNKPVSWTPLCDSFNRFVAPDVYRPAKVNDLGIPAVYDNEGDPTDPELYWSEADKFLSHLTKTNAKARREEAAAPGGWEGWGSVRRSLHSTEEGLVSRLNQAEAYAYISNLEVYGDAFDGCCGELADKFLDNADWLFDRVGRAAGGFLGCGWALDRLARFIWPTLDAAFPDVGGGESLAVSVVGRPLYHLVHLPLAFARIFVATLLRLLSVLIVLVVRLSIKLVGWLISRALLLVCLAFVFLTPFGWMGLIIYACLNQKMQSMQGEIDGLKRENRVLKAGRQTAGAASAHPTAPRPPRARPPITTTSRVPTGKYDTPSPSAYVKDNKGDH